MEPCLKSSATNAQGGHSSPQQRNQTTDGSLYYTPRSAVWDDEYTQQAGWDIHDENRIFLLQQHDYADAFYSLSAYTGVSNQPHHQAGFIYSDYSPSSYPSSHSSSNSAPLVESMHSSLERDTLSTHLTVDSSTSSLPPQSPLHACQPEQWPATSLLDPLPEPAASTQLNTASLLTSEKALENTPQHSCDCPRASGRLTKAALSILTDGMTEANPKELCDHPSCALRRVFDEERCRAIESFWTWSPTRTGWVHTDEETGLEFVCPQELD